MTVLFAPREAPLLATAGLLSRLMRARSLAAGLLLHACSAAVLAPPTISRHSVALPALRIGGEWAGHTVEFSPESGCALSSVEVLACERWNADRRLERRTIEFNADGAAMSEGVVLPFAQSGSEVLTLGARMLEPDVLNIRAWALDAVDETSPGTWDCEAIIDGLSGDRPAERAGALECPKVRTRVRCRFDPTAGRVDPASPVAISLERCWSVTPSAALDEAGPAAVDAEWRSAVVGMESFGEGEGTLSAAGIELHGEPGLLRLTLRSGTRAQNGYSSVSISRSWVGECCEGPDAACSVFTEVEVTDDTTGDK